MSSCGFTGNKNLLEADEYRHYLDVLGKKYEVMNLCFKLYPCCRWAHPAIDFCVEIYTVDGKVYVSPDCEPRGEACENIGVDWLVEKFHRIAAPVVSRECRERLVALITGDVNVPIRKIVDAANEK